MAETKKKTAKPKSPLAGAQAVPTTLDTTTKLDIDTNKVLVDTIIDTGLHGGLNVSELEKFTSVSNSRDQIYTVIDTMAKDSAVAAIIKTYADSTCEMADNGHIIWCESNDSKVSKFVNYLLNVMNVDKQIYKWTYCLVKYGDVYLRLFRESDYDDRFFKKSNIDKAYSARNVLNEEAKKNLQENVKLSVHAANDPYSYYVEMVPDPSTMFELTKYGTTFGYIEVPNAPESFSFLDSYAGINNDLNTVANYRMKSNDVNVYQADDFVHACLDEDFSRYPETVDLFRTDKDYKNDTHASTYSVRRGKSMLIDNYKTWREKALLENSILLNRVTKSSLFRKISVEMGDAPKEQVQLTLRRVKEMFEQKTAVNTNNSMAEYNNPGPVENNLYFATHNGKGEVNIEAVGGDIDVKNLADLDNWVNKFYAGFGVPKAYYGYTDDGAGFNGGQSLSIISSVFAKGVTHLQNALIQAVTDAINLVLVNKGYKSYLNNFVLKMKPPLTQEELSYRENLVSRVNAISNLNSLFTDVEDKARRLEILKTLVSTLNYGDDIIYELDAEIKAVEEKAKQEAEQAKKEAKEQAALEAQENASTEEIEEVEETTEAEPEEDLDLGISSVAPTNEELIIKKDVTILDDDSLPTPEEISEDIDFTKAK